MNPGTQTYNGEWWLPDMGNEHPVKYFGSVNYTEDKKITLELVLTDDAVVQLITLNECQPVLFGIDFVGNKYTIFNTFLCYIKKSTIVLTAEYFLIGAHVKSLDEKCFIKATIKYPNLKYWALYKRVFAKETDEQMNLTVLRHSPINTLSVEIEEGVNWNLRSQLDINPSEYEWHIYQDTDWGIKAISNFSICQLQQYVTEITQFFSVAVLSKQNPSLIFLWQEDTKEKNIKLLFKQDSSDIIIRTSSLIPYEKLYGRMSSILQQWHKEYDLISPICSYLISSLGYKSNFTPPDFIIVAQALDGYYNRYFDEKKGRDDVAGKKQPRPKYEKKIEIMLKHFKDVEVIDLCQIQPKVLADSRNKYSHLSLDDKSAVKDIKELRSLTTKATVLLICCVLERMGLTIDEINMCCTNANIKKYWL